MTQRRRTPQRLAAGSEDCLLPHNLDAERSVLGSILIKSQSINLAREILREEDFYLDIHRKIFKVMEALSDRSTGIDEITLKEELSRLGDLASVGGHAYLASLADGVPSPSHIEYYARIVAEKHRDRQTIVTAQALSSQLYGRNGEGAGEDRDDINARAEAVVEAIERMRQADIPPEVPAEDLAEILSRPVPETPWAVRGLIARGDVGIISGAGGLGKTWLMLFIALCLATGRKLFDLFAVERSLRVAFLDLESRPWETDQRLHRAAAGMGLLSTEMDGGFVRVIRQRLRFDRPRDVKQLLASLKSWGTEFLFVDSFRRMHGGDENRSETTSALFLESLDMIRLELGCGTIVTDHTRKATGEKELDSAELSLRGSTDKRNLADFHLGIEARQERLAVIPTKTRHSRLPEAFLVEIAGLSEDGPEDGPVSVRYAGSLDRASDKVQDACLAILDEAGDAGLLRGEIIGRTGYSERSVDDALRALKGRCRVSKLSEGRQARYIRPQRPQTTAQMEMGPE